VTKAITILVSVVIVFGLIGLGMLKVGETGLGYLLCLLSVVCAVNGTMTLLHERERARKGADGPH
jgi:hypothetical protein